MSAKSCPHGDLCKEEGCAVYNPFLKGCGLMVGPLALGGEIAECRRVLERVSVQIDILTNGLVLGLTHSTDALESLSNQLIQLEEVILTSEEGPDEVLA